MKKVFFLLAIATTIMAFSPEMPMEISEDVYICNSSGGRKYHYSKSCRGLSSCKAEIKKLSLDQAKKIGKTLCGWED